jgi:hypothetical protein
VLGSKIVPQNALGGNKLDSTAPSKRRGKERETKKAKRKTKLKRIILASREARRQNQANASFASPPAFIQDQIAQVQPCDEKSTEDTREEQTDASKVKKSIAFGSYFVHWRIFFASAG